MFSGRPNVHDRILRDDTAIVFDLHVEIVIWQDPCAELEDFCESIGAEPVFGVAPDMCLEQDLFFFAGFAAAIDEFSNHVTDFGDVNVSRNVSTVRQHESRKSVWVLLNCRFQVA